MPKSPQSNETVAQRQSRFNRSTRSHWLHFAPHRAKVMELILTGREFTPGGTFCALGAGNCNDLELARLLDAFEEVHLADIDPSALQAAVERQGVAGAKGLRLHAPIDLTGIAETVSAWRAPGRGKPALSEVHQAVARVQNEPTATWAKPLAFDVVLSCCLLSQLVGYATDTLGGDSHPGFRQLVQAIRARHLRQMLDLLKPGGTGLLVCDLVSSDSLGELPRVPEHELGGLIQKLSQNGNFFSGLFPEPVLEVLRKDSRTRESRLLRPWLWRLGPGRSFLVYAIRFKKHPRAKRSSSDGRILV